MSIEFLENDFDKVSYLANLLTARATGLSAENSEFEFLRRELLQNSSVASMLPNWIKQHRNLDSFWGFIKEKYGTYAERRTYISEQFTPLLDLLEFGQQPVPTKQAPSNNAPVPPAPAPTVARNKRKVFMKLVGS